MKPQLHVTPKPGRELKKVKLKDALVMAKRDSGWKNCVQKWVSVVNDVINSLQAAYVKSGSAHVNKLSVDNKLLESLSALDSSTGGHNNTLELLESFHEQMSNV